MKVALFVPCYIDQFYPQVAIASMQLLAKLGVQADFPAQQTCCWQPMANSGCEQDAKPVYHHFVNVFQDYDYVVGPAGSCVYHVRKHFDIIDQTQAVCEKDWEPENSGGLPRWGCRYRRTHGQRCPCLCLPWASTFSGRPGLIRQPLGFRREENPAPARPLLSRD